MAKFIYSGNVAGFANLTEPKKSGKVKRSPHWDAFRDYFISKHSTCAACGKNSQIEAHHIIPFHIDKSKELLESNLIALCDDENSNFRCHLEIGHLGNFFNYNVNVRDDAKLHLQKLTNT